jgi:hypothetical protein
MTMPTMRDELRRDHVATFRSFCYACAISAGVWVFLMLCLIW